ncbi:membrane-spanning 4-domains subfamily A member 15 [Lepisosteus oculatus]|uniref:Si:ch211-269k10.5 n=1 Tax=Lepisosteus oculatus TaxID=7918 RepID=W5MNI0_LEPOC|nr:PREDICTED: membrane-spanning 4-domains subfamily A member 15-like [Lepisosteus oculatus]
MGGLTYMSDHTMVITIPFSMFSDETEDVKVLETFNCVFKDAYKVFLKGQPKALGTAQIFIGLLSISFGLLLYQYDIGSLLSTLPSMLFIVSGTLSYSAGSAPNMLVMKTSFVMNILSFFWSIAALVLTIINVPCTRQSDSNCETIRNMIRGIQIMNAALLVLEVVIDVVLLHWESKAVFRPHFNVLPVIYLKQDVAERSTAHPSSSSK